MGRELDLMAKTLDKIDAILDANPQAKAKVEAAMDADWCDRHGPFYRTCDDLDCPACEREYQSSLEADRQLDQAREDKHALE